jgi:hypothetical protein
MSEFDWRGYIAHHRNPEHECTEYCAIVLCDALEAVAELVPWREWDPHLQETVRLEDHERDARISAVVARAIGVKP